VSFPRDYFERELAVINNEDIKEFTASMLELAPQYFFTHASSSTGKYHPEQSQGHEGLLRHTRAVVYLAIELCASEDITGDDRDAIISASLLHDLCKYGIPGNKHTVSNHDYIGAYFIHAQAKKLNMQDTPKIKEILSAVANHYGRWTKRDQGCPQGIKKYPEEFTAIDRIVHQADFISSRRPLRFEFLDEPNFIG
jgi:HD superfamily phosphohydrolase YqeK